MKKTLLSLFVLSATLSFAQSPDCMEGFPLVRATQPGSQWCWASAIQMVLDFNAIPKEQCEVVTELFGVPACHDAKPSQFPARTMEDVRKYFTGRTFYDEVRLKATLVQGALTQEQITGEIDDCRPVMVELKTSPFPGSTHLILITGYYYEMSTGLMYLTIADPCPKDWSPDYSAGIQGTTYAQLKNIWKSTIFKITEDGN